MQANLEFAPSPPFDSVSFAFFPGAIYALRMKLDGLTVLVTGGTGSLGNAVIRRLVDGRYGRPKKILVFSRDEMK